jgi:hypothetical protein
MIIARPDLGRRLALASRRFFHAIAAFVSHSINEGREAADIAHEVDTSDVRELLALAVPQPHERLYTLLDRLAPATTLEFYRLLNSVLHGPAAAPVLEAETINMPLLRVAQQLSSDPVLFAARSAIGCSEQDVRLLVTALAFLRSTGLARDIESLPPKSGWRAIRRRIAADLGRIRAVIPPFCVPEGWQAVEDLSELWKIGREKANCVGGLGGGGEHYMDQMLKGKAVVLSTIEPPRVLAAIHNVGPALWAISEISIRGEPGDLRDRRELLRESLAKGMAEIGHTLLDMDPMSAMRSIAWRARRREYDLEDDA